MDQPLVLSLPVLSFVTLTRAISLLAVSCALITGAPRPAAAQGPETQIRLHFTGLRCLSDTRDNFGLGSDETYAVFWVADIQGTRSIGRAFRSNIFEGVDGGETRSQTLSLWHPLGGKVSIPSRDDIILLAAVLESDDTRATAVRDKVNSDLNTRLITYKRAGLSHAEMVDNLKLDMENAINLTRRGDTRIGPVKEIRPSDANLQTARSGGTASMEQSFAGGRALYILNFQLRQ